MCLVPPVVAGPEMSYRNDTGPFLARQNKGCGVEHFRHLGVEVEVEGVRRRGDGRPCASNLLLKGLTEYVIIISKKVCLLTGATTH